MRSLPPAVPSFLVWRFSLHCRLKASGCVSGEQPRDRKRLAHSLFASDHRRQRAPQCALREIRQSSRTSADDFLGPRVLKASGAKSAKSWTRACQEGRPSKFWEIAADVIFLLAGYGIKFERNIALCPETWRILQRIPGLKTAMFSIFEPHKHLPAIAGFITACFASISVCLFPSRETRSPSALVIGFVAGRKDGQLPSTMPMTTRHGTGRNKTQIILSVDFVRSQRFSAHALNWIVLNVAVFTPYIREGYDHHRQWKGPSIKAADNRMRR